MKYEKVSTEFLPEIVEVNYQIFNGMYEWPPYTIEKYRERFEKIMPVIFVAKKDSKIVGDAISFEKDGNWYLWILGVLPDYRKQGIAGQLFELNEKYAKENGYKKVIIKVYNVSKDMLRLAIKRGYQITDLHKEDRSANNSIILELSL